MKFYLFKNLLYLCKHNLKKEINMSCYTLNKKMQDAIRYLSWIEGGESRPKIKTPDETIEELINTNKSCVRFGDGEFQLILGKSIPFQKSSKKLQKHLLDTLKNKNDNIITCIPYAAYYPNNNITDLSIEFWKNNGYDWRNVMKENLNFEKTFYSSEMTMARELYKEYNNDKYFSKLKQIWENKDITIICGKTVFNKIENNIFDNAKSIEYQYTLSKNAYKEYDKILQNAKKINKNRLIIIICGPTATVLAYDLANLGYRAIDFGHALKSYDWYLLKKSTHNQKSTEDFFAPD